MMMLMMVMMRMIMLTTMMMKWYVYLSEPGDDSRSTREIRVITCSSLCKV